MPCTGVETCSLNSDQRQSLNDQQLVAQTYCMSAFMGYRFEPLLIKESIVKSVVVPLYTKDRFEERKSSRVYHQVVVMHAEVYNIFPGEC